MDDIELALSIYVGFCIACFVGGLLGASWLGKRLIRDTEEANS